MPNRHTTSNPCQFNVHITSIRRRANFDEYPRHFHVFFDVISLIENPRRSHVLFRRYFAGRKIDVISTYFYQCNFAGRKIHVVATYLFRSNFNGWKVYFFSKYFFRCNFSGRNIHVVSTMECISMFLLIFFDGFVG